MKVMLQENVKFHIAFMPDAEMLNRNILQGYMKLREQDFLKRTHFFCGRYENLYLQKNEIPAIEQVMRQAERYAADVLKRPVESIRSGFWINDMGPGEETTRHDHDENDELLSGVYYVKVPEQSGNLCILDAYSRTEVASRAGMFVFFAPEVQHSVSKNHSQERRISIGMNFGPR
jgi:hypothetical protein